MKTRRTDLFAGKTPVIGLLVVGALLLLTMGTAVALQGSNGNGRISAAHEAVLASMEARQQAAAKVAEDDPEAVASSKNGPVPANSTPEPWPQGLFDHAVAPVPPGEYLFQNQWQWDLDGHHVQVFAGQIGRNSPEAGRGVIWALETSFDLTPLSAGGFFKAPPGTGSLRIVSYDGTILQLISDGGQSFQFDAESLGFSDQSGQPVPSDTPAPADYIPPKPTYSFSSPMPDDATPTPAPVPTIVRAPDPTSGVVATSVVAP
jgi:hypothetical protein